MTSNATDSRALLDHDRTNGRSVVAAIGGGHGLAATLEALAGLEVYPVGVVGTADDGSSSGRLRAMFPCLPPGDLRMACGALAGAHAHTGHWPDVLHQRFPTESALAGHAVGNLLLMALLLRHDPVTAMVRACDVLGLNGLVLPAANQALDLVATVRSLDGTTRLERGQVEIAVTPDSVESVGYEPTDADAAPEVVDLIRHADSVVMGPGSWWTSVIPPLLLPGIHQAVAETTGLRILVLNLGAQLGETSGYTAAAHIQALAQALPDLRIDVVIADPRTIDDASAVESTAATLGAVVEYGEVARTNADGSASLAHNPVALRTVLERVLDRHGRINACR